MSVSEKALYSFDHVTKAYEGKCGSQIIGFDNLSFDVLPGEIFGIIGLRSVGRNAMKKILSGAEKATYGSVYYRCEDMSLFKPRRVKELSREVLVLNLTDEITDRASAEDALSVSDASDPRVIVADMSDPGINPECAGYLLDGLISKVNERTSAILLCSEINYVEKACNRMLIISGDRQAEYGNVKDIFINPKSNAARSLVFPDLSQVNPYSASSDGGKLLRIAFEGHAAKEPVIADLVAETGEKVSILSANTRSIGGMGYGQMVIQLPDTLIGSEKVIRYLKKAGIIMEEL